MLLFFNFFFGTFVFLLPIVAREKYYLQSLIGK